MLNVLFVSTVLTLFVNLLNYCKEKKLSVLLQSEIRYTLGPLYNKKLQKNKVGTGTKTGGWDFLRMKNKIKISRDSIHLYNDYLYTLLYLVMSR